MTRRAPKRFLAGLVLAFIGGCASASSPTPVPTAVPALGSAAAQSTTYAGVLVHVRPGLGPLHGWRIRSLNNPGSIPIDVSKVVATARSLGGKKVLITAHTISEPGGRLMLQAETLVAYTATN